MDNGKKINSNLEQDCLKVKQRLIFFINLIVFGGAYGMFLAPHYSIDSYCVYYTMDPEIHLKQSRFLNYFIIKLFREVNINTVTHQSIFTLFMIMTFAFVTTQLACLLFRYIKQKSIIKFIIINIAVAISFINVFILEWFLYPEIALFYSFSILTVFLAIISFEKGNRWINSVLAFILLCMSLNFYQAAMPLFVIYLLAVGMLRYEFTFRKEAVVYNLKVLIITMLSCVNSLILQKLAIVFRITEGGDRDASLSFSTISNNILEIIKLQKSIWYNTYGFLPKYVTMVVFIILLFVFIVAVAKKISVMKLCYFILVVTISYSMVFAPHVITESLWFAQRTIIAYFSIFMIIVCGIMHYNHNLRLEHLTICVVVFFLALNIYQIQSIGVNHYGNNKLDQEYAILIQNEIDQYEQETGNVVTKIACDNDTNPTYSYSSVDYTIYDTNIRGYICSWADVNMINFYNGKNYERVAMEHQLYSQYFEGMDWNYFNPEEQMIFVGDTLNIIFY